MSTQDKHCEICKRREVRRITNKQLDEVCLDCCDFVKVKLGCIDCGVERLKRLKTYLKCLIKN